MSASDPFAFLDEINARLAAEEAPAPQEFTPAPVPTDAEVDAADRARVLDLLRDCLAASTAAGDQGPTGLILMTVGPESYRKWAGGLTCSQMIGFLELYKNSVLADWLA